MIREIESLKEGDCTLIQPSEQTTLSLKEKTNKPILFIIIKEKQSPRSLLKNRVRKP